MIEVTEKCCSECENVKPLTEFYSQNKKRKDGTEYIYYNLQCKECTIKKQMKYKKEHPEVSRTSYQRHKEKRRAYGRKYNKENKDKLLGYLRKWQQNNREKTIENNIYRKLNKTHRISNKEWNTCKEYFNFECAYCGINEQEAKQLYDNNLHKEHVEHNGENDLSNCVPSCKACNSSKGIHTLEEWYDENKDFFTYERLNKIIQWLTSDYLNYIDN